MKKNLLKFAASASIVGLTLPMLTFAVPIQSPPSNVTNVPALLDKVCDLVNVLFTVLLIVAIVFVMLAAFKYLTAGGDPEKVKAANHQILYAAVAIVVGIFAKAVPLVIGSFLSSTTFSGC